MALSACWIVFLCLCVIVWGVFSVFFSLCEYWKRWLLLQADINTNVQDETGAFYGVTSQWVCLCLSLLLPSPPPPLLSYRHIHIYDIHVHTPVCMHRHMCTCTHIHTHTCTLQWLTGCKTPSYLFTSYCLSPYAFLCITSQWVCLSVSVSLTVLLPPPPPPPNLHTDTCTHTCMHTCVHTHICRHTHTHTHTCAHAYTYKHTHAHACTHTRAHKHGTCTYTHIVLPPE